MQPVLDNSITFFKRRKNGCYTLVILALLFPFVVQAKVNNTIFGTPETEIKGVAILLPAAPVINEQPADTAICEGADAGFSVSATGTSLTYEWFVDDGSTVSSITDNAVYGGQGTNQLQLTQPDQTYDQYSYHVVIDNGVDPPVVSSSVVLTVDVVPAISTQPVMDVICESSSATFEVTATGSNLSYQWYESTDDGGSYDPLTDVGDIINTQTAKLSMFNVDRSATNNLYRVVVSSGACNPGVTSSSALLEVKDYPKITAQSQDITLCEGTEADFSVTASGSDLVYQWKVDKNDGNGFVNISGSNPDYTGATTANLKKVTTEASGDDGNVYNVYVSGYCHPGKTSEDVILTVNTSAQVTLNPVDATECEDDSTSFSVTVSGSNLGYQWRVSTDGITWNNVVDDGTIYSGSNSRKLQILNSDIALNSNQFRVNISSNCTPVVSGAATLTVLARPTPSITGDAAAFPVICGGSEVNLDGNPAGSGTGNYTSHVWTGDTGNLDATDAQKVTFYSENKGSFTLTYSVTDDNNCTGQDEVTLDYHRPGSEYTSDASPQCGTLAVNFENLSTAEANKFLWDFGDGNISTVENPVHLFMNNSLTGQIEYYTVSLEAIEVISSEVSCRDTSSYVITVYPETAPEIHADTTAGCAPFEIEMYALPGAAEYHWDFGDSESDSLSHAVKHTFLNRGSEPEIYETVLVTTSTLGCTASDTIQFTVYPIGQTAFKADPATVNEFPEGGSVDVTFDNQTSQVGPWTFTYDFGDGDTYETLSYDDIVHTYTSPGVFTVKLVARTAHCSDSINSVITINPIAPEISFSSITEGCHPLIVEFTNTTKFATEYTWQFGDGFTSTLAAPSHTFNQPGSYTVKLIATGAGGISQLSRDIEVYPTPQVFFSYAPDSVFVGNVPVKFFNMTSYADTYLWNFGDYGIVNEDTIASNDNTTEESDPSHIYKYEGWRNVSLRASNENCSDSMTIEEAVKVIAAGEIVFPTAFSPGTEPTGGNVSNLTDPSAKNSVFFPGITKQVEAYKLFIYSRWGDLVFQSDDINIGWDGFINGKRAAQGVYIWKVAGIYANGIPFSKSGDVTLIWQF